MAAINATGVPSTSIFSPSKFFQPTLIQETIQAQAVSTVVERKTLSGVGGKVGTRELQGF